MAHPDFIHETYHISHIAEWFHAFPHVDITFQYVNSTFDPSNSTYLEALGIIIAIPGFWLILTLLAFLIFFLCRCCDSGFRRKRKITPLKWTLGFFAILCCGALAVGLYGNDTAHNGIVEVESASRNISVVINSVKTQPSAIERLLNHDVEQDLAKLNDLFDSEKLLNTSVTEFLQNSLQYMRNNVTIGLTKVRDINHKVKTINLQVFPNMISDVEFIRWPATIGLLCLLIVLCFTLIWGVIKHSRCLLILFSVFGLLSVVVCWILVSMYVGICVAGSDFCLDPEPFLYQQASGILESSILTYYIHCDESIQDPFKATISEGTNALQNVKYTLLQVVEVAFKATPQELEIHETLNHLSEHIKQTEELLHSIIDVLQCSFVNREYKTALEATCTDTLEGTAFMLVSAVGSGLLFTVLIWVASHTWIHIRKRPTAGQIDEEDPFLPPPATITNSRRNRETNGHSGSREDHAFLHGRYTPPPARAPETRAIGVPRCEADDVHFGVSHLREPYVLKYDQLSGGHLMGHVGSKMHYKA